MKKFFLFLILTVLFYNCSLLKPSTLLIKNKSDYIINVTISGTNQKNITINKNSGEMFFINPGNTKITVNIEELFYKKKYKISIGYLENKMLEFDLKI